MPKIIHFEDDQFLSDMYKFHFEKAGFNCISFKYPPENLIEMIKKEKPDLIIMDIIMPKMDGFKATEILKSNPETKDIPICGLCNMSQKQDIDRALSLGMKEYWVSADFSPTEIVEKVKRLI